MWLFGGSVKGTVSSTGNDSREVFSKEKEIPMPMDKTRIIPIRMNLIDQEITIYTDYNDHYSNQFEFYCYFKYQTSAIDRTTNATSSIEALYNFMDQNYKFMGSDSISNTNFDAVNMTDSILTVMIPAQSTSKITTYLQVSNITTDNILLQTSEENVIYHLNKSDISFVGNQDLFYYVGNITLEINYFSELPISLNQYYKCKLSTKSSFIYSSSTVINSTNTVNHKVTCIFENMIYTGVNNLTLIYRETLNNYAPQEFQISNNSLGLVVTDIFSTFGINPNVIIIDKPKDMSISTGYPFTKDFGSDVEFNCKYGIASNKTSNTTIAVRDKGKFTCSLFSNNITQAYFSIWMKVNSIEKRITNHNSFFFADPFFFAPSYGKTSGNEIVIMDKDEPQKDFHFLNTVAHTFPCIKIGTILNCTTPVVNTAIDGPFNSYIIKESGGPRFLVFKYILYEQKTIVNAFPSVIDSKLLNYELNVTLNSNIFILKGNLVYTFGDGTNFLSKHNLINTIEPTSVLSNVQTPKPRGIHDLSLYYRNIDSIELDNQFIISNAINLTFVDTSGTISVELGDSNIVYTGIGTNITINLLNDNSQLLDNPLENIKDNIKCKSGSTILTTYRISNTKYICELFSNNPKTDNLALWYIGSDALNGEFKISNKVKVIYVKTETSLEPVPLGSILSKNVTFELNDNIQSLYKETVKYYCKYHGIFTLAFNINGTQLTCLLEPNNPDSEKAIVELYIESVLTQHKLLLSNNVINYYFFKSNNLLSCCYWIC